MQLVPRASEALVPRSKLFTPTEEATLLGFLDGYAGLNAYQLDLCQWVQWCTAREMTLLEARRADIERFGRELEARGRARTTIARRLCTMACFYR